MLWLILAFLGIGLLVAVSVGDAGSLAGLDGGMIAALVGAVALLIFIGGAAFGEARAQIARNIKDLAIWVGFILLLVLGYSFKDDAKFLYQRLAGELLPPGHTMSVADGSSGQQAVRIRRQPGGHFVARASINGQDMTLLVDTGATSIVLKQSDARAAGIDVDALSYRIPVRTANGLAYAASS